MASKVMKLARFRPEICGLFSNHLRLSHGGELGSGAGKGGGAGGTVREVGGSMGKKGAIQEEEYFRKLQQEQLHVLKEHADEEIDHHKKCIKRLQKSIKHYKEQIEELEEEEEKLS